MIEDFGHVSDDNTLLADDNLLLEDNQALRSYSYEQDPIIADLHQQNQNLQQRKQDLLSIMENQDLPPAPINPPLPPILEPAPP